VSLTDGLLPVCGVWRSQCS